MSHIIETMNFEIGTLQTKYKAMISDTEKLIERNTNSNNHDILVGKLCIMKEALIDLLELNNSLQASELGNDIRVGIYNILNNKELIMTMRVRHWVADGDIWDYLKTISANDVTNSRIERNISLEEYMSLNTENK